MRTVYGGLAVVGQQPVAIEVVDVVDALFSEFVPGGTQGGAAGAMALALGWKESRIGVGAVFDQQDRGVRPARIRRTSGAARSVISVLQGTVTWCSMPSTSEYCQVPSVPSSDTMAAEMAADSAKARTMSKLSSLWSLFMWASTADTVSSLNVVTALR